PLGQTHRELARLANFLPLALGPHPQRELTLTPSRGFTCSRLGVAAGALPLALGPHPQRELTLPPSRGFTCPRLGVAAGALPLALRPHPHRALTRPPPPARTDADTEPRIHMSSARCGRRRYRRRRDPRPLTCPCPTT